MLSQLRKWRAEITTILNSIWQFCKFGQIWKYLTTCWGWALPSSAQPKLATNWLGASHRSWGVAHLRWRRRKHPPTKMGSRTYKCDFCNSWCQTLVLVKVLSGLLLSQQEKVDLLQQTTGCPKKNKTGFLLNILATNHQIFNSFFFSWKLRSICIFRIQNHFCAVLGIQNKMWFSYRSIHIHIVS